MEFIIYHHNTKKHLTPSTSTITRRSSFFLSGNIELINNIINIQLTQITFLESLYTFQSSSHKASSSPNTLAQEIMHPTNKPTKRKKNTGVFKLNNKKIHRLAKLGSG
jgi:hypothetical protein